VETSQHPLGESFGRKIIEIILSFRDKDTPAQTPEEPGPIQWKSIVMESTPDAYRELYLLTNNGMFDRNQGKASLYSVERSQILEVAAYLNEKLNGNVEFREDSYWVLEADGPRPIDFSAVGKGVAQITPPDSHCTNPRCGLDMKGLELRSLMQRKNAECHACEYLGWVTARFRLDGYRAIPVSSRFEPYQEPYLGVAGQRTAHSWRQAGCELPQHLDSGIENSGVMAAPPI